MASGTEIYIPRHYNDEPVTAIGKGAFSGCISIRKIIIPESTKYIDNFAFNGCAGLESIVIPDSVTSIRSSAFFGCDNLAEIYYCGSEESWRNIDIRSGNAPLDRATVYYIA